MKTTDIKNIVQKHQLTKAEERLLYIISIKSQYLISDIETFSKLLNYPLNQLEDVASSLSDKKLITITHEEDKKFLSLYQPDYNKTPSQVNKHYNQFLDFIFYSLMIKASDKGRLAFNQKNVDNQNLLYKMLSTKEAIIEGLNLQDINSYGITEEDYSLICDVLEDRPEIWENYPEERLSIIADFQFETDLEKIKRENLDKNTFMD